jgi:hypothetical protein
MHTGRLRDQRGYLDYPVASSPCHSQGNLSYLSFDGIKDSKCSQIDESGLTIVRVIGSNGAIPIQARRSVGSRRDDSRR